MDIQRFSSVVMLTFNLIDENGEGSGNVQEI